MTPEEFKRKYEDTHTELQMLEMLEQGQKGNLVKYSPGDKNIAIKGKIPGKALIESIEIEKRTVGLQHCLLDAVSTRVGDFMDIPMDKLTALALKSLPQKVDGTLKAEFTFADMVKRAQMETVEVEE